MNVYLVQMWDNARREFVRDFEKYIEAKSPEEAETKAELEIDWFGHIRPDEMELIATIKTWGPIDANN